MKKKIWLLFGAAAAIITLYAGWWLVSPLFFDKEVNEAIPMDSNQMMNNNMMDNGMNDSSLMDKSVSMEQSNDMMIYTGHFTDGDDFHKAQGTVKTVIADETEYLRFEEFETTNGPDLYVYLVESGSETKNGMNLGKLKGNLGDQNYELPSGTDLKTYNHVVIYCKQFNVDFGTAVLEAL